LAAKLVGEWTYEGEASMGDVIELVDDGHRTRSSHVLGDDDAWATFMTAHYRRRG
jgi:hypothetical protein